MTTASQTRRSLAALGVVLAVGLATSAGLALADPTTARTANATADDGLTDAELSIAGASVDRTETARVRVVLDEVPEGLAGYRADLEFRTAGVANFTGASYPDSFAHTTEPAIGDGGQSVTIEAVDLEDRIQPGATNVTLATLTVAGVADGETAVEPAAVQFDADDGSRISPSQEAGTVTVESADAPPSDGESGGDAPGATDGSDGGTEPSEEADEGSDADGDSDAQPLLGGAVIAGLALAAVVGAAFAARRDD